MYPLLVSLIKYLLISFVLEQSRSLRLMDSNQGTESTNPPNIVTIESAINTVTTSVPTAWPGPAAGITIEPQSLHSVPPTGKRQRTSLPNDNRSHSSGQVGYSLSDTVVPNAPPYLTTYPGNGTSITSRFL